ncbi:unnamed protein product [Bursaphelenchus okinawaensis]|uniref:DNA-directed RNA polymerase III subunit RPC3 n=1 Tax=Bursaphelenchus okinawaensis TaxID=465554 RepID=A0A811LMF2_9BILA|nr:unnamed protein product [Bursaphelenchus okinawaensis]CAG9127139.1 unnamed protein product [Bursaphelenchus okinawaensis]
MASTSKALLCEAILADYFGYYVSEVGRSLLKCDQTFRSIHKSVRENCRSLDVKKALVILENYDLLTFTLTPRGVIYKILPDNIIRFCRIFRAITAVKQRYGVEGEAVAEEVFSKGKITFQDCSNLLIARLNFDPQVIKKKFELLVQGQILRKVDDVVSVDSGVPIFSQNKEPFYFDASNVSRIKKSESGATKRLAEPEKGEDIWQFNWKRVDYILRDELVLECIKKSEEFDEENIVLWNALLQVAGQGTTLETMQSDPIAVQSVCQFLKEETGEVFSWEAVDKKLANVAKFMDAPVRRMGDSGGGLYVVEYNAAFQSMCFAHVESLILELIDERAVRIFRIVRKHRNIEEDELSRAAMLAVKEAKEIAYALIENGIIYSRPIAKTNDFAPARTYYFYSHKMPELVDTMMIRSLDSIRNLCYRRVAEVKRNEVLLATKEKVDTIIDSIQSDATLSEEDRNGQEQDVRKMYMTVEDKRNLKRHQESQKRLHSTEIKLEEALFVFQLCDNFQKLQSRILAAKLASKKRRRNADMSA